MANDGSCSATKAIWAKVIPTTHRKYLQETLKISDEKH